MLDNLQDTYYVVNEPDSPRKVNIANSMKYFNTLGLLQ